MSFLFLFLLCLCVFFFEFFQWLATSQNFPGIQARRRFFYFFTYKRLTSSYTISLGTQQNLFIRKPPLIKHSIQEKRKNRYS